MVLLIRNGLLQRLNPVHPELFGRLRTGLSKGFDKPERGSRINPALSIAGLAFGWLQHTNRVAQPVWLRRG